MEENKTKARALLKNRMLHFTSQLCSKNMHCILIVSTSASVSLRVSDQNHKARK